MDQGGDSDVFGGTTDPRLIGQLLRDHTEGWFESSSNARQPEGANPLEPGQPGSDPGEQFDDLESLDLRGPSPPPGAPVIHPFVLPQMDQPDFISNRDRDAAYYAETNAQSRRRPTFGQSLTPTHVDPREDRLWLAAHSAQIFDDPRDPQTIGRTTTWTTRARYIGDQPGGNPIIVDYTRVDTATFAHADPQYSRQELAQSTRWIVESYREVVSELDEARVRGTEESRHGVLTARALSALSPSQRTPRDFHRPYSIQEDPPSRRVSNWREPNWRDSERRERGSYSSSPVQSRRRRPSSGSQSHASGSSSGRTQRPVRWGEREQYTKQEFSVDARGIPRRGWQTNDKGTAHGHAGGTKRWESNLEGCSKNGDLTASEDY